MPPWGGGGGMPPGSSVCILVWVGRDACLLAGGGVCIQVGQTLPHKCGQTNMYENITFPQLRLRTVDTRGYRVNCRFHWSISFPMAKME